MTEPDFLRLPRLEQWALLEAATGRPRTFFLREGTGGLSPAESGLVDRWARQRSQGQPLAYLLGFREFYGYRFWVNPAVLIPRAETELLVEHGLAVCGPDARLLDLGTGSGCIAISIIKAAAAQGKRIAAWATDQSAGALATAKNNACWHGVSVQWALGDWFEALGSAQVGLDQQQTLTDRPAEALRFDLIVSNPPYIAAADPHLQEGDLRFEPAEALSGIRKTQDGLGETARIISQAPNWLRPGGSLLLEHGWNQQTAVAALCKKAGFSEAIGLRDLTGTPRAVHARL
ncbi:MAG: peptide chain release factor N(5)-glutamine methyltransferase [Betaproteobacteria bacterium]|nr:peptide chain release factor N(5)-glutamine methyltransferase [Betaproteobacteria bacterium]